MKKMLEDNCARLRTPASHDLQGVEDRLSLATLTTEHLKQKWSTIDRD